MPMWFRSDGAVDEGNVSSPALCKPAMAVGRFGGVGRAAGRTRRAVVRSRRCVLPLAALVAFVQPVGAQSIPGVAITATISVAPPSATLWEKHPTLYPGIDISPSYLLPSTAAQAVTVSGGRSSFRHFFCIHKEVGELRAHRRPECHLIANRTTPTSVELTEAMIDHGGVAWHITVAGGPSIRAQWLPIPATKTVALFPASAATRTEYQAEIHPKANGLRVRSLGAGTIAVRVNGGAVETVTTGATRVIDTLAPGTNTLTVEVAVGGATTTYTATLTRSLLPDASLRAAVARTLGKPPGEALAVDDLLSLRTLNLTRSGVSDLAGLDAATNLDWLALDGNGLKDVADLSTLRSLSWLDLSDNALSNLEPLSGLASLRTLLLSDNAVSDLTALGALTELRELTLSGNAVSDLSPLSALTVLEQLWLDDNDIRDVRPLGGLPALQYLHLGRNRIANVLPLGWLPELKRLWLNDNAIEDIAPLWSLRTLQWLDLERNAVREVAALRHLAMLERLRLRGNRVADIAPLVANPGLGAGDAVGLRNNPLTEASIRDHVPALRVRGATLLVGWPVLVFPAADDASGRQGFVRVINRTEAAGEVLVEAVDDAGARAAPVRLAIGPRQARHFNSADLEMGNAAKGLSAGVGAPVDGAWRLALASTLALDVLAYVRTPDGFLTAVHDVLARDESIDGSRATIFNPARNRNQASALRLVNPTGVAVPFTVWGVDDRGSGRLATGLSVPPGGALTVPATTLEAYRIGKAGRGLGRGTGKWRLDVNARWPVAAVSLLTNPSGHLTNLSSSSVDRGADGTLRLPLFPSARSAREGFVRVANRSAREGAVWITAIDDAGERPPPVALRLLGSQTAHINSDDLEDGAPAKGLPEGVGPPTAGDWRLELTSDLDFHAHAYVRAADGFLTSMHDVAPTRDGVARVAFFNPASNQRQRSLLRIVNNGAAAAAVTIRGVDDAGAQGGVARATVPARQALTFSAVDLETGAAALRGALDDGDGKWRLTVASEAPLVVMSLLASASGHLTNLSTVPAP